jgi:hypothetical protein
MDDDSGRRQAIEWLRSLKPDALPDAASAERLRTAVATVVAAIERGEYEGLTGADALCRYCDSLPESVRWPRPSNALFKYGEPALRDQLLSLPPWPRQQPPGVYELPPRDRIEIECCIVDDWAVELFEYCRTRPQSGLRMTAMLDQVDKAISPWDRHRIGLHTSIECFERIVFWQRLAMELPP